MTALRATSLTIGYSGKRNKNVVLERVHLQASSGELVCLLGPNGIGKSTLLRTLSKVQPALSGEVEIEGVSLQRLNRSELARRVGVVLTERPIIGALPAYRLVELGRYPHVNWLGQLTAHDHEVVEWAIDAVSARHLAARDTNTLSDGERQRFMIARALAQEPSILLLDEPTAFLDVAARAELMGLLRRLARQEHLAIVVSTHDLELALRTADRVWVILPDRQLYTGAPEDMILKGCIQAAFPAETIHFLPLDRTFRPVIPARGYASVGGAGLTAGLAEAVLEREGFKVVSDASDSLKVFVSQGARWEAVILGNHAAGEGFAALAKFLRDLPEIVPDEGRKAEANRHPNKIGR